MKVQEIENMEQILPNNVYVIPSNKIIKVTDGHIQLSARQEKEAIVSIDILFTSLAQTHQEKVIGVILSGNASDGTQGLKAIKDAGGITFAQDTSAQANSMPDSAIAAGIVDYVLDPVAIARELVYLSSHNFTKREHIANVATNDLNTIFQLLQKVNGIDFSHYKTPTIRRRINHKMQQKGIRKIQDYIQVLQENSQEVTVLSNDLLINVTKFFRDPDAFFYLETHLFPDLFRRKTAEDVLRIWVPACSTGEEAYSIAMLIHAIQEKNKTTIPVQIFATDLSEVAIAKARAGTYLHRDVQDIAAKYKDRYFTKSGDKYHVIKEIREMCIFAPHNILQDPPFSRMDFVSCCNLLIYFDAAAQKKVFSSLHFALRDGGFLMLGKAESVGTASLLFTQIEPKYKIYLRKKNVGVQRIIQLQPHLPRTIMATKKISPVTKSADHNPIGIENAIDAMLLANYMPACAVINKEMEVLQFRGAVSMFLEHPSGKASLNILKLAKTEFAFELRIAIQEALKTKGTIYKSDIEINIESKMKILSIEVSPLKIDWDEPLLLVVFKLTNPTQPPMASSTTASQKIDSGIKYHPQRN
jgi:two-component system CheB/CheR fusion protein